MHDQDRERKKATPATIFNRAGENFSGQLHRFSGQLHWPEVYNSFCGSSRPGRNPGGLNVAHLNSQQENSEFSPFEQVAERKFDPIFYVP